MNGSRTSLFLRRSTAAIVALTAFLVAVLALSDQLKPSASWVYCSFVDCTPPPPPAPPLPSIKLLKAADLDGLDGGRSKSGRMSDIQVSITNNPVGQADTFVASWVWSGSGGSQGGSQNVVLDMKSKDGATVFTYTSGIDRSHCYYTPGNRETRQGSITGEASLIDIIAVRITEVTGKQGGC
ncbi:hypothetical protein [Rhizobium leguminosarum]|nr:hypothetical protein [Rhizobium leguminosarum]